MKGRKLKCPGKLLHLSLDMYVDHSHVSPRGWEIKGTELSGTFCGFQILPGDRSYTMDYWERSCPV